MKAQFLKSLRQQAREQARQEMVASLEATEAELDAAVGLLRDVVSFSCAMLGELGEDSEAVQAASSYLRQYDAPMVVSHG